LFGGGQNYGKVKTRQHVVLGGEEEMTELQESHYLWKKSTVSGAGSCVEVAGVGQTILVRDSRDPSGPILSFARAEWETFLAGVRLV
jgi:hypothetical protein